MLSVTGELDTLISSIPHAHLVMAPVFGAPAVAHTAQLIIIMAGDYRSKKEVAHLLVPAMGRKIIDLGGNLEKGTLLAALCTACRRYEFLRELMNTFSTDLQAYW